ncbi:MAG TPA: enoyl-CoA hydratase/isomerase family protein [Candidatus Dormibacteraeota bacterium]|nr:enoyl-CoA hydratase/isomerase family protein [Candidatus Dormibacteraeota bacterium]
MRDLHLEVVDGVAMLVIDRPGARNALALQTMDELDEALETVRVQRARVLVIRGAGEKAFCAGGDIKELEAMRTESEAAAMAHRMRATLDRIPQLALPVIAGLNGDALGGGAELAIACDFRIAAEHARIGFPQINLGIMPAWGASERLASLVGRARALAILLGGQPIAAPEALQLGLVESVVSGSKFEGRLRDLAGQIAEAPPAAVAGIKSAVNAVRPHRSPDLEDMTVEAFARTWSDPAHWKAVEKMEKRRRDKR